MKANQSLYQLETLSFIHIGTGDEVLPPEMLLESNRYHRIDMASLFQDSQFDIENYLRHLDSIDAQKLQLSEIDSTTPLNHILYSMSIGPRLNIKEALTVHEMIKTARSQLYVPGSSIKGSIFSAIFWDVLSSTSRSNSEVEDFLAAILQRDYRTIDSLTRNRMFSKFGRIDTQRRGKIDRQLFELLKSFVFEKIGKGSDQVKPRLARFLRWLEISDTKSVEITPKTSRVLQIETYNTSRLIPLRFEMLNPGLKLPFTVSSQQSQMPLTSLFQACDNFYNEVIDAEQKWFKEHNLGGESFHSKLKKIEGKVRLGQGSGCWTTSLLVLAKEFGLMDEYLDKWKITRYHRKPKTRKLVQNKRGERFPLGWARIIPVMESENIT
ncbi:MAG: type III-A CRISPR-associated RAMP protein Csm5 [Candidatus Hodarchaeota archaeon]